MKDVVNERKKKNLINVDIYLRLILGLRRPKWWWQWWSQTHSRNLESNSEIITWFFNLLFWKVRDQGALRIKFSWGHRWLLLRRNISDNIDRVFPHFQTQSIELTVRSAAECCWGIRTSRFLKIWEHTASSVWYIFLIKTTTNQKTEKWNDKNMS